MGAKDHRKNQAMRYSHKNYDEAKSMRPHNAPYTALNNHKKARENSQEIALYIENLGMGLKIVALR